MNLLHLKKPASEKPTLSLAFLILALNVACVAPGGVDESAPSGVSRTVRSMEPGEVRQLQLKGSVILLQMGTDAEFDQRHLESSVYVSSQELDSKLANLVARSSISSAVVLYSPNFDELYSDSVQAVLRKHSDRATVMRGGLSAWEMNGFPVVGRKEAGVNTHCRPVTASALRRGLSDQVSMSLIDLRQKEDFDAAHLPGSVSASPSELNKLTKSLDKNRTTILYHRGGIADLAAEQFARQGFRYCGYLVGGYEAWLSSKDSVSKP